MLFAVVTPSCVYCLAGIVGKLQMPLACRREGLTVYCNKLLSKWVHQHHLDANVI